MFPKIQTFNWYPKDKVPLLNSDWLLSSSWLPWLGQDDTISYSTIVDLTPPHWPRLSRWCISRLLQLHRLRLVLHSSNYQRHWGHPLSTQTSPILKEVIQRDECRRYSTSSYLWWGGNALYYYWDQIGHGNALCIYSEKSSFNLNHVIIKLHGLLESPIDSFPAAFTDLTQIREWQATI